jgi:hypothetical protein
MRQLNSKTIPKMGKSVLPPIEPRPRVVPMLPLLVFIVGVTRARRGWDVPTDGHRQFDTGASSRQALRGANLLRGSVPHWLRNSNRKLQLLESTLTLGESATSLFLIANSRFGRRTGHPASSFRTVPELQSPKSYFRVLREYRDRRTCASIFLGPSTSHDVRTPIQANFTRDSHSSRAAHKSQKTNTGASFYPERRGARISPRFGSSTGIDCAWCGAGV